MSEKNIQELARTTISKMNLHGNVLKEFSERDIIYFSLEPVGILYYLKPEQLKTVKKLEEEDGCKVWHVIKGQYKLGNEEIIDMETYLVIMPEDAESFPDDILTTYEKDSYITAAYVKNLNTGEGIYEVVEITKRNGGITRVS